MNYPSNLLRDVYFIEGYKENWVKESRREFFTGEICGVLGYFPGRGKRRSDFLLF